MNKKEALCGIRRTIKRLDSKIPKWRRLIDKDELDLGTIHDCPCGQVFGEYEKGLEELEIYPEDSYYYALSLPIEPGDEPTYSSEYAKLTQLWKEVI